ncbi:MAG: ribosomal-protein-alanine N-acetyltransferase [Nitrospiraceae bacterium]|nr:MAG: ribosomal-protein-alanine N-acetyltransferase [Nitrospiraceae bacterium]
MEGVTIRQMTSADLAEVHAIENLCYSTPWSLNSFKYELGKKDTILKVAVSNGRVTGYVCVRTILDVTHLLNITVLPESRRKGIAGMLLSEALDELRRTKPATQLTLEVRQSNTAAIRLYEKFGFKVTGKRKNYYHKPDDDAVLMEVEV